MKNQYAFILIITLFVACRSGEKKAPETSASRPNVVLILTDDQGIGDIGYNGNPFVKTPNLDALAAKSTRFTSFYVSPVCAPTRSSIMTGKYSLKTGVYDTYNGGAIMAAREVTIAEILHKNGYKTAIFGKWHLGDDYPFRPIDQGFDESLIHKAGGMGQVGDVDNYFAFDSAYFNPVLYHNEQKVQTKGYCSDVFTDGAIDFIKNNTENPFFLYLPYNAPHTPLQLPMKYYEMYQHMQFNADSFPHGSADLPPMSENELEAARRVYGMVTNIDDNILRLEETLKSTGLWDNTVLIFLTDNGPQQTRYKMGFRGKKGSVYEAGIRVPFFIHFPQLFPENKVINAPAAHIDLLPTILDILHIKNPVADQIDGQSLLPLLNDQDSAFTNRVFYSEWLRGFPIQYWNMAARKGDYKLVGNTEYYSKVADFELYNLAEDPGETTNIIQKQPEIAGELKNALDQWYHSCIDTAQALGIQRIQIGSQFEDPVILNRNDAKGEPGIWNQDEIFGYWDVQVVKSGKYNVRFKFVHDLEEPGRMYLKMYPLQFMTQNSETGFSNLTLEQLQLSSGNYRVEAYYQTESGKRIFPFFVEFKEMP